MEKNPWIDLGEELRLNINASIICPNCSEGLIIVQDVPFDDGKPEAGGERILQCSNCNSQQAILYRNLPENWMAKGN